MIVHLIEAANVGNWGKFALLRWSPEELRIPSTLPGYESYPVITPGRKFGHDETMVIDLQTGEGAAFILGGGECEARYQLNQKHQIWVCPLYEPFLVWLHEQPGLERGAGDITALPRFVELPEAEFSFSGYRRQPSTA